MIHITEHQIRKECADILFLSYDAISSEVQCAGIVCGPDTDPKYRVDT